MDMENNNSILDYPFSWASAQSGKKEPLAHKKRIFLQDSRDKQINSFMRSVYEEYVDACHFGYKPAI